MHLSLNLSISVIQRKAKDYCSYQERSHAEIIKKLHSLGARKAEVEQVITWLIEENYLNEERFASQFARGKFNLKKWGRIKIKQALKQKGVNSYNINLALDKIDENTYIKTLEKLANKKFASLKAGNLMIKKMKTIQYLLQKGYERPVIQQAILKLDVH